MTGLPHRVSTPLFVVLVAAVVALLPLGALAADWPTYHLDNTRAGNDTTQASFTSVSHAWTTASLGGAIYAEPLYYGHNVYVATETDDLYAFDGATGTLLTGWPLHLGTAVDSSSFPCGNINPVGITSTPVIDTATGYLYAAGLAMTGPSTYAHHLWAINPATRSGIFEVAIDAPGADPTIENQRGALAVANGRVYVPFGGRIGDCGNYHGYVVSVQANNGTSLTSWGSTPNTCDGGIWAPGGVSLDGAGNVYAATGNGQCRTGSFDYSESVVKLSGSTLALQSYWAPSDWLALDQADADIGSITPVVLGSSGYLFQAGKNGVGYVLNTGSLGGVGGPANAHDLGSGECFGASAFDGSRIYVPCSGGLFALSYNGATHDFSGLWSVSGCFADSPILAGGAVWFKDRCGNLKAVDPASGSVRFTLSAGTSNHFSTPSAGDGRVFLSLQSTVVAYNLVSSVPIPGNGSTTYTLDGLGGVHPAGTAPGLSGVPSFGFDIGRALAIDQAGTGGVLLDGYGGLHPLGTNQAGGGSYWPGWDIARAVTLAPWNENQGWTMDAWGGIHAFGGAPGVGGAAYWPGWSIARGLVVLPDSSSNSVSGYTLDGYGGLHPFGNAPPVAGPYWPGFDIARGVALLPGSTTANPGGYVLDGWGGIHPFGNAPAIAGSYAYWSGWDIARGMTVWDSAPPGQHSGWTLDGYGALHEFGGAPALSSSAYQGGHDIFRACSAGGFPGGWDSGARR